MLQTKMIIIDDLELEEAVKVADFLNNAIDDGDLDLAIKDCIRITDEIKFHPYKSICEKFTRCELCNKSRFDTIHEVEFKDLE
jgi:hypothetical protein